MQRLITIARGAVPLALFGAAGYGHLIGRIALPFLMMQAIAPLVLAFVAERASDPAALAVVAAFALMAFVGLRGDPPARAARRRLIDVQANSASMSSCVAWPASPSSLGPLTSGVRSLPRRQRRGSVLAEGLDAAPDLHHAGDAVLDEFQRRQHLGDALAGEVVEIAGLEDAR